MVDQDLLVEELHEFALRIVTDHPAPDALHDLVGSLAAIFGIHGVGVCLVRGDRLEPATASPEDVAPLEEVQVAGPGGPCVDAFRSGDPVLVTDLSSDPTRWPELAAVAARAGIASVAAVPLQADGTHLGVLDLYDTGPRAWSDHEVESAELVAEVATRYLVNAEHLSQARQTSAQLQQALASRIVIEQAKGFLAGRHDVSVDTAFDILRDHARRHRTPLREVARAVVDGELRL